MIVAGVTEATLENFTLTWPCLGLQYDNLKQKFCYPFIDVIF